MKVNKVIFSFLGVVSLLTSCKDPTNPNVWPNYKVKEHEITYFSNPVYDNGADPSIIRDKVTKKFYAYPTSSKFSIDDGPLTFINGPILESTDLVHWTYKGCVFPDGAPTWGRVIKDGVESPAPDMTLWAPDIVYMNNEYHYYYTLGTTNKVSGLTSSGIGLAVSETPYGPWVDKGKILDGYDVGRDNCIDACVRTDTDGRVYMFFGSFSTISVIELDSKGYEPLHKTERNFGRFEKFGSIFGFNYEGSYFVNMFGKYYFFGSGGSCCKGLDSTYFTVVFMSDSLMGEYVDEKGVNANNSADSGTNVIDGYKGAAKGPGHISVIEDDAGDFFLVYHAYDSLNNNGYRKLMIDKLVFDVNGFPKVKGGNSSLGGLGEAPYIE